MTDYDDLGDFSTNKRVLLLALFGLVAGVISSFAAYVLLWLINLVTNISFFHHFSVSSVRIEDHHLGYLVVGIPVVGALIIGLMARYGSEKIRGHGIPEALEAILLGRSRLQLKVAILKPISSAISIGTGGPFGAEGPIIMTGGAFGSLFAQLFHLTAAERKVLLVAGAAAGMSAVFAAPVAGVLFAVELLLFEWKPRSFIPVAVACITASILRISSLGSGPIFHLASHAPAGLSMILSALLVGILAGFGSAALTKLVYGFEDLFERLPVHWMWWPAIGAVFIGLGGLIDPRVLGVGYENIADLLAGKLIGATVLLLLVDKALIWSIALGSGTSGGVLAPLLIMGGGLGAGLAGIFHADVGLWAAFGMAAMMGGTMRAPLTATVFAIELTYDFNLFPALLTASVAGMGVTVLLMKRSILTEKLARRGQHVTREYSIDTFELMRVADIMDSQAPTVPESLSISELASRIAAGDARLTARQGTIVLGPGDQLLGILTRGDLVRALQNSPAGKGTVGEIASKNLILAYPEESVQQALDKMLKHNIGRLPVVSRENPTELIGYIGRASILAARHKVLHEETIREEGWLSRLQMRFSSNRA
jgi:CIC family chloride channel protein